MEDEEEVDESHHILVLERGDDWQLQQVEGWRCLLAAVEEECWWRMKDIIPPGTSIFCTLACFGRGTIICLIPLFLPKQKQNHCIFLCGLQLRSASFHVSCTPNYAICHKTKHTKLYSNSIDILVDILSRVPAKALCRCKCVSKHWLGLVDHPDHRKRLPQTLAGFFYGSSASTTGQRRLELPFRYTSLSGDRRRAPFGASFTFLPNHHLPVDLLDSCNGLLLCRCYHVSDGVGAFRYVVCNPATEKWVVLPNSGKDSSEVATTSLGFDPAASPHFHVFELVVEHNYSQDTDLCGVAVYSSETGEWIYKEKRWNRASRHSSAPVFLDGLLFFRALDLEYHDCVAAVDTKGETWMKFRIPGGQVHDFGQADGFVPQVLFRVPGGEFDDFGLAHGFIQRSQGRVHFANFQMDEDGVAIRFVVHVLEDYQGEQWKLKHSIKTSDICGWTDLWLDADFDFIAIHPECNLLFFISGGVTLMCYNMDSRQVKVISYLGGAKPLFLPYVPLYTESPSLHI